MQNEFKFGTRLFGERHDLLLPYNLWRNIWVSFLTNALEKCYIVTTMIHIHIYMRKHSQHNNDERTHFFRKIYFSHFIRNGCESVTKGLCVRGELETEQTATYWPQVPLSLAALLSRSAGLLNRGSLCRILSMAKGLNQSRQREFQEKNIVTKSYFSVCGTIA